jgi:hypothetical protein
MQQGAVSAERIHLRNEEKRKRVQALLWVISTKLDVQALFKCCGEVMPANHTRPSNCGRGVIALEYCAACPRNNFNANFRFTDAEFGLFRG